MNPIRFPRAAVNLAAAPDAELVQIKQNADAAVLTVTAGQRVLRLAATPAGQAVTVDPFTISAVDLVRAAEAVGAAGPGPAHELPLVVVQISANVAGIAGPSGTPQTVTISTATLTDPSGTIDAVQGERASGMTRAVAAVDPRHLRELADDAIAIGCTAMQFTFAPRFGQVLVEAEAGPVAISTALPAGEPQQLEDIAPHQAAVDDDPLVFTMSEAKPRGTARRSPGRKVRLPCEENLPW